MQCENCTRSAEYRIHQYLFCLPCARKFLGYTPGDEERINPVSLPTAQGTNEPVLEETRPMTADDIALWFFTEYTRLPIDGEAYRALVNKLRTVSLPNHANQLAELIGRVHTFADQLLAWGYKDIAHQILTEILIGPVVTDDTYATLQETRADLQQAVREIDELRNTLEAQSRTVVHQRRSLEEAEEELGRGELLHALAAIGRGLEG
jgi:hypothetical protein